MIPAKIWQLLEEYAEKWRLYHPNRRKTQFDLVYPVASDVPQEAIMRIGVPKEIKDQEYRVGMTPGIVSLLSHDGAEVVVETQAGAASAEST